MTALRRLAAAALLLPALARAQDSGQFVREDEPRPTGGLARRFSVGPRFSVSPGVFVPGTGSAGFSLGLEGGYGFDLGPVVLAPTLSAQGAWSSDWTVYEGLGGARVTLPLGSFGPYVEGGLGYGHVSGPGGSGAGGLAVRVGGGFLLFFSESFGLGLGVRYESLVDTGFHTWSFVPSIFLSF